MTCQFPEGMSPAAINDGTRGMMAAVAKYRDDNAGGIVTTGTLTSYVVSSFQGFDNTTDMDGKTIAFSPHVTNGDTVLLEVDGLGIFPLRSAPGVELLSGTIVQGTPYAALFNKTAGEFYLKGFSLSPFNVPFLGGMDYWDTVSPGSCFIFPNGQAISRTVYAKAFARWGVKFGAGDGATTFNVPPKGGRVSAMIEGAAALLTAAGFVGDSTQIGSTGGLETYTIQRPDLPNVSMPLVGTPGTATSTQPFALGAADESEGSGSNAPAEEQPGTANVVSNFTPAGNTFLNGNVTQTLTKNVQPTITCNYIIRIF